MPPSKNPDAIGTTRECVGCGNEYVVRRWDQRSCGNKACAKRAAYLQSRSGERQKLPPKPPIEPKVCGCCGETFTPTKVTQKWCSRKCNQKMGMRRFREREDYEERMREYRLRWRVKQPDGSINEKRRRERNKVRWSKFGATEEDYEFLGDAQDWKCAACHVEAGEGYERLVFDHCHTAMTPRGLLCQACNKTLGYVGDSIPRLLELVLYLVAHETLPSDTPARLRALADKVEVVQKGKETPSFEAGIVNLGADNSGDST